jgi:prophage regulatory protein
VLHCFQMRSTRLTRLLASLGVRPDEVVGLSEIAELYGVARHTAWRYSRRPDFPEPLARLGAGNIWRRTDVEAWRKANLPLKPGRPRKAP